MSTSAYNVLIVDDQPMDRHVLARQLTKASSHYNCTLACDIEEALSLLEEQLFDICLTDFHLGNGSALDLIHKIQAMGIRMPILVVTGSGNDELGMEVIKAGADDFFPKEELSPALLSRTVQHILIRHRAIKELHQEASEDWLTATASRRHFEKVATIEVNRAFERQLPISILLVDMDNLKLINDTHGHEAGDIALKNVSSCLREELRQTDLLSRWGGDEFCILLDGTNESDAQKIAEKLRCAVQQLNIEYQNNALQTSVSIGVACYPNHRRVDVAEIFRAADRAVYKAKSDGRNCVRNALLVA